jgi:hypothetical protein
VYWWQKNRKTGQDIRQLFQKALRVEPFVAKR